MVSSARTHTYIAFLKRGRTVQRALGTMILCGIGSLQNQYVPVHHAFKRYNKGWLLLVFCSVSLLLLLLCFLFACLFCLIVVLFVLSLFLLLFFCLILKGEGNGSNQRG